MSAPPSETILIAFPGFPAGDLFERGSRDNVTEPFVVLKEMLTERGYSLETAGQRPVDGVAGVVFWDWSGEPRRAGRATRLRRRLRSPGHRASDVLYDDCVRAGIGDRLLLIVGEPPSVSTTAWDTRVHRLFDRILTYDDDLVDGVRYLKYHWPIAASYPSPDDPPYSARKLLASISANKSSRTPGELYSERRRAIAYYEREIPDEFGLYGVGWDEPTPEGVVFASYRGAPDHKWQALPGYRFSVCYENTGNVRGYVTEKIFDSLRCGCVPVYLGAPNVADYVDPAAFVDRRAFGSDAEVLEHLRALGERDWQELRAAGARYLESDACRRFQSRAFAETVIRGLLS